MIGRLVIALLCVSLARAGSTNWPAQRPALANNYGNFFRSEQIPLSIYPSTAIWLPFTPTGTTQTYSFATGQTIYDFAATGATWTNLAGGAYSFDGNDYLSGGTLGTIGTNTGNMTIAAWIKYTSVAAVMFMMGVVNDGSGLILDCAVNANQGGTLSAGRLHLQLRNGTAQLLQGTTTDAQAITNGAWHHVAWVSDTSSTSITFYVNGVLASTTYGTRAATNNYPNFGYAPTIGARNVRGSLSGYFNGQMGDFAIITRTATSNEVWDLFQAQAWKYEP